MARIDKLSLSLPGLLCGCDFSLRSCMETLSPTHCPFVFLFVLTFTSADTIAVISTALLPVASLSSVNLIPSLCVKQTDFQSTIFSPGNLLKAIWSQSLECPCLGFPNVWGFFSPVLSGPLKHYCLWPWWKRSSCLNQKVEQIYIVFCSWLMDTWSSDCWESTEKLS